jgi:hypothetical protein
MTELVRAVVDGADPNEPDENGGPALAAMR